MPDLIGQTLGSYRIINQIGKGGMATVYKAYQPSLERYVAVKVLPPYYAQQDETFLKRFRLEARSVAHLRHPNILTIYEYGEENETTYIVMEYVEAGTLTELLGQPLPLRQVEPILKQVASALQYAHEQNVIHRDVKPSNILLPKPDWPLLTDFGLARIVGGASLTQTGAIAGTPAYMSPEQGRGETPDHRTDIYSLGIVLYEMVTGAVPFTAETPMAVIVKHMIEPLPLPRSINPDLPERVEAVILKALAKMPADRYAHAGEVAQAYTDALSPVEGASAPIVRAVPSPAQGRSMGAPKAAAQAAAKPRSRILPIALGLAAVAACGFITVAALAFSRLRNSGPQDTSPIATLPVAEQPGETRPLDQLMADAVAKLDQGDIDGAVSDFQAAIAADPQDFDRYWEITSILSSYGYPEPARGFTDAGAAAGPDEAGFHDSAGWSYYDLGALEEAVGHFQRAIELDSESLWSYIGMADALQLLGDWDSARTVLDALAAHEPVNDPDLYENLGWNYSEQGAHPEAQAAFRYAVTLDAARVASWTGLIDATYYAEGTQAAWNVAQEATAANREASLYDVVGNLAWQLGDTAGAEAAYLTAIELDPAYPWAYISLADMYDGGGRLDEALALLELGLERNPEDAWIHEALGQRRLDLGEVEVALNHFRAASAFEPTHGWFPLQAAEAYYQFTGDAAGSSVYLERASAAQPDDADLLDSIGSVYESMGDCASAYAYYSRALELNPGIENSQAGLTRCGG